MAEKNEAKRLAVFTTREVKGRTFWTRIGVAFRNRDGSTNVVLEALPLGGRLHIREEKAKDAPESPVAVSGEQAAA